MKKLLIPVFLFVAVVNVLGQEAVIKVDILRQIGDIDRNIYGVFMEPIRNSMDGLLYNPKHPLANKDGFRTDYIEAAKDLQLTNMRWPGGNYTLTYDWKDGIGPKENRPVRRELAWNVLDRNQVGTDEWLQLAKAMNVESSICINVTTASLSDARYWVEYVNSPTGSYYADLRAKYGHPEPYNVKYWHIGNEVEGEPWQAVALNSKEYVAFARDAANIMYYVNRGCQTCTQPVFIVMGSSWIFHDGVRGKWEQWNSDVINGLITQRNVEYIAIHRYWGSALNDTINRDTTARVYLGDWARHLDDYITTTSNQIKVAKIQHDVPNKPFYIAFTEWSPRGRNQMQTLAGALHFNDFIRHADVVKRANYTMFTSLLSQNQAGETFKTPFYYMFKLYSTNVRGKSLDTYVKSGTFDGRLYKNIPYLDVSSSYSEADKTVVINVVNRNMEKAVSTEIFSDTGEFKSDASIHVINADDIYSVYSFDNRQKYLPVSSSVKANGRSFKYSFAPHSFTQIKVKVE